MSVDATLAALADPARRAAVDLLRAQPRRAGELAARLSLTPPAMSRHLRVLRASGLVTEDHGGEDARVRVYTLRHEPFDELRSWVEDVERFWTMELASFKRHAEKTRGKRARRPAR